MINTGGRMVAHRHTGRPEIRYRYDSDGRVTEQLNPAGLSYTYQYEKRPHHHHRQPGPP